MASALWKLSFLAATATALRRNFLTEGEGINRLQFELEALSSTKSGAVEHALNAIQGHEARRARSALEGEESVSETPGLRDELLETRQQLKTGAVQVILLSFNTTQEKIDEAVTMEQETAQEGVAQKTSADSADKVHIECVDREEQLLRKVVHLQDVFLVKVKDAVVPCQAEDESETFTATGNNSLSLDCNTTTDPNCTQAVKEMENRSAAMEEKLQQQAERRVAQHKSAEERCMAATAVMDAALIAVGEAQDAWVEQHWACQGAKLARNAAICDFGKKLRLACAANDAYVALINSTVESQAEFSEQWNTTQLVMCILGHFGNNGSLSDEQIAQCQQQISPAPVLNTRAQSVVSLTSAAKVQCQDGTPWTFAGLSKTTPNFEPRPYDQTYPSLENATLAEYTTNSGYSMPASMTSGTTPFTTCPLAPKPDVESRPPTGKTCDVYMDDAKKTLGNESHSVMMGLDFTDSKEDEHKRQWILNIGQTGKGAEHWLWTPSTNKIQFGNYGGPQIGRVDISKAQHTLATVYDAPKKTYSLYIDGEHAKTRQGFWLDIKNSVLSAGVNQNYKTNANFNGCVSGVNIYYSALTAGQIRDAAAKFKQA